MPIRVWIIDGSNRILLQAQGVSPHFFTLQFAPSWVPSLRDNGLEPATLSLDHLVLLTIYHFIYFSDVT